MTRNRKRGKRNSSQRNDSECTSIHSVVADEEARVDVFDSVYDRKGVGTGDETITSWTCVMVLILDQYLRNTDDDVANVLKHLHSLIPAGVSSKKMILELGRAQSSISQKVEELEDNKRVAKELFAANVEQLSRGVPYERLPLIDKTMTISKLERMIAVHSCDDSLSSSASGSSTICDANSNDVEMVYRDEGVESVGETCLQNRSLLVADEVNEQVKFEFKMDVNGDVNGSSSATASGFAASGVAASGVAASGVATSGVTEVEITASRLMEVGVAASGVTASGVAASRVKEVGVAASRVKEVGVAASGVTDSGVTDSGVTDSGATANGVTAASVLELLRPSSELINVPFYDDCHWVEDEEIAAYSSKEWIDINGAKNDVDEDDEDDDGDTTQDEWQTISKKKKSEKVVKPVAVQSVADSAVQTPWSNGKFLGEFGEMRRKTTMCKNFKLGICGWADKCNYAHTEDELVQAHRNVLVADRQTKIQVFNNTSLKLFEDPNPSANIKFQGARREKLRKTEMCENFKMGKCLWGKECNYAHSANELKTVETSDDQVVPATNGLIVNATPAGNMKFKGHNGSNQRKTEMCENFKKGKCFWGKECNYAHSVNELRGCGSEVTGRVTEHQYDASALSNSVEMVHKTSEKVVTGKANPRKLLMCKGFQLGTCRRTADDCNYAHHEDELDQSFKHSEPCGSQQCAGRLRYERRNTIMCPNSAKGCKFGVECTYAHSYKELRQLPKHEMCVRHRRGRCQTPAAECVYAHTEVELRPKTPPRQSVATKSHSVKEPSGLKLHNLQLGWNELSSPTPNGKDGIEEECLICTQPLDNRIDLECGHDVWHFKCISKWLNEVRAECPLCSKPAQLPDLFQAPAGLSPQDFPAL